MRCDTADASILKYCCDCGPVGEGRGAEVRKDVADVGDMAKE